MLLGEDGDDPVRGLLERHPDEPGLARRVGVDLLAAAGVGVAELDDAGDAKRLGAPGELGVTGRGERVPLRVLEATIPRDAMTRAIDLVSKVYRFPPEFDRASFDRAYSARTEITHRISVRGHIRAKRASMRAHASQASGDGDRTLGMLLRIPRPLYDLVLGREWYRDPDLPAGSAIRRDVFEDLQ